MGRGMATHLVAQDLLSSKEGMLLAASRTSRQQRPTSPRRGN